MSDSKKQNDGLQDYIDLLEEFSSENSDYSDFEETYDQSNEENTEDFSDEIPTDFEDEPETEDILSNTPKEKNPFKRILKWYKGLPKKKKIIVSIIAVILAIILILGAVLGIFVVNKFNLLGDNFSDEENYEDIIYDDGEFNDINIDIGSSDFKQSLIDWATAGNDSHMSSKNVINVLLVGADSRKGENSGNTDVMMLVSLNKKTKQLKLISFLRDSYLYVEGKNTSYCTKLNAAFSMGGAECLMQTIENNYKIDIDNYVMVNFESFKSIIDEMGGITVDVKKYEADYNYKKFKIKLPYGDDVTLDGEQALCFCRIRGCDADGDVSRTRRQRQVIEAIIQRVNEASISDLNKYIDILLPYVDTGYSKSEILSLGLKALAGKWYAYEQSQLTMPTEDTRTSGSANAWIWVVDYELAAHNLQMEIYGQSNIPIDENRTTIIDVYRGANYKPTTSSSPSSVKTTTNSSGTVSTTAKTPVTTNSVPDIKHSNYNDVTVNVETTQEITEEISTDVPVSDIVTEPDVSVPESTEPTEPTEPTVTVPETTQEQPTDSSEVLD